MMLFDRFLLAFPLPVEIYRVEKRKMQSISEPRRTTTIYGYQDRIC